MIDTRPIEASEWRAYRDMRLRALQDSPDAFGSTYAAEATRTDEDWATRIASALASGSNMPLFALDHGTICGLVWCKLSAAEPDVADIVQMWVAPSSRGRGAGRALLDAALTWVGEARMRCVRLVVTVANTPAMRLSQARGFRRGGALEPLREGCELMAQSMALELELELGSA